MQRQLVFAVEIEIDTVLLHYKTSLLTLSKSYSSSTEVPQKALFSILLPWMFILFYLKFGFRNTLIYNYLFKYGNWFYDGFQLVH
jgi:hypothetical protein